MIRFYTIRGIRNDRGLAFIWILLLLAMISALSVAFLNKVGIGTAATETRGAAMQAHYLARSAANHALWRLLNDPGFPASETVYYMHDSGNNRYGYKVRIPTLTTFATVATVGAVGDVVSKQSYVQYLKPYNIITTYGRAYDLIPEYRRLLGATWVDAADTVDIGSDTVTWMVLKGAPQKTEMIMGTLDADDDINFTVWDGTSWGNLHEFTTGSSNSYHDLDIAYESQSEDALVVGRYGSGDVRYNIWNGTAWASATALEDANLNPTSSLYYIDMASNPNSDEIMIALVQWGSDLKVVQWDGDAFYDHGEPETGMETTGYGSAAVVYEQQSGDALILWGHSGSDQIYYALWNGASLSSADQLPNFGDDPQVIRAAADPTSDYIVVIAVDASKDLNVAVWDGSAWSDSLEISTDLAYNSGQVLDVAWEHSGEDVVIAWAEWSKNVYYFVWQKGTALSAGTKQVGPDLESQVEVVRLQPIVNTEKIILLTKNGADDLRYSLWTGNTFIGDPAIMLETVLAGGQDLPFDVAEFGTNVPVGADDFSPPDPDPMTWASSPAASGPPSITMTATTATDENGVQYFFECTAGGGNDSGWQNSPTYEDTGLSSSTQYTYRVKARDKSSNQNETGWSSEASATTEDTKDFYVNDITMGLRAGGGGRSFGQATVWIKDDEGSDIQSATVYGDWSGCLSESVNGLTGVDGKIMIESSNDQKMCTWTFTVTLVVKGGYTYNSALNVETSDSIAVP